MSAVDREVSRFVVLDVLVVDEVQLGILPLLVGCLGEQNKRVFAVVGSRSCGETAPH